MPFQPAVLRALRIPGMVAGISWLVACSNPFGPGSGGVSISVESPGIDHHASRGAVETTLRVTVRNDRDDSIFHNGHCGTSLERERGKEWLSVWVAICTLGTDHPIVEIRPGEEMTTEVRVGGVLGAGVMERWSHPVDGAYRVRLGLRARRGTLPERARVSESFTLRTR
jgi:hypothetical protein